MYIGIPCIILDYNHQTKNIISECFNYGNSNIFCQSKEDVINKIKILSENKNYFDINKEKFFSKISFIQLLRSSRKSDHENFLV